MTDIVERLRNHLRTNEPRHVDDLCDEAADLIERLLGHIDLLHGEIERLRVAKAMDDAAPEIERMRKRITWLQDQIEELQKDRVGHAEESQGVGREQMKEA